MQQVDREGYFKGQILAYGLEQNEKTGTVNLSIQATFDAHFHGEEWIDWHYDHGANGYLNLVKKDGTLNEINMKALIENAGWDGNWDTLANQQWQPPRCSFKVKQDEYNGKTSMKIDSVNPVDYVPGARSVMKPEAVKDLNARFGSQVRALASSLKRNAAPPTTPKPPSPPPAPKREVIPAHAELEVPVNADGSEIPF